MNPLYQKALNYLNEKGKQNYGKRFEIAEEDIPIITRLIAWFLRDEATAKERCIDLDKGIMLTGPVGCGKTALMNMMRFYTGNNYPHVIKPCRDIAFEFQKTGFEVIRTYAAISYHSTTAVPVIKTFCFDDLGTEQSLKHFGQECNIMAEIILSRYDHYIRQRMATHFTTNLSADEIEKIYGSRVRSRLREMCNLIAFPKDAPDKRK
ncbi:ATPase [Marinilabiliaceae bacterium ANBcel2]|nr:ATPase [Marinilabiliaceae bacterium ANBcel2]